MTRTHPNQSLDTVISLIILQHMAVCGLSLQLGSSEAAKLWNKILSSKSALLIPTVSRSAFHSANLFLFSHHHIPTSSVAPFAAYKPNTIHYSSNRSDEGLMLETLTSKLFKVATSRFQLSFSHLTTLLYSPTNAAPQFL